jgi:hypothetical protein
MLHEGMSFSAEIAIWPVPEGSLETFSTNDVMKDCLLLKNQVDIINEANPSWDSKRTSDMLCEAFLAQKSNMEPNVMCETIATTLFDDKDLILTVFRHVPTKYVFAVVTSYKNSGM